MEPVALATACTHHSSRWGERPVPLADMRRHVAVNEDYVIQEVSCEAIKQW